MRGCIYHLLTLPYLLGILYIYAELGGWYGVFGLPLAVGAAALAVSHITYPDGE
jgi:hypothetical protein